MARVTPPELETIGTRETAVTVRFVNQVVVWLLCGSMVAPPAVLAQAITPPASSSPQALSQISPYGQGTFGAPFVFGIPGNQGQPIITSPTALQPLAAEQAPCPTKPSPDLTAEATTPDLNDYWPVEPNSLLPGSVEQRMRQEQEERDRLREKLQVEKEKREVEHHRQVEREKREVVSPRTLPPSGAGTDRREAFSPFAGQEAGEEPKRKPFTAELLRKQDFSVEEAFTQFSVLQGVKSHLRQFGYEFFDGQARGFGSVQDIPVGPDYVIGPLDSLAVHVWNVPDQSFNRSYISTVERDGTLMIPQVGAIPVGGLSFSQAERIIHARLGALIKRFEVHVAMARIRTMKVYVVGEVLRPGAYEVSALATVSNAIYAACGPARSGSLRQIKIVRGSTVVAELDLYDFLLRGDRSNDRRLQAGDVVLVPSLGPVAAIGGAVKRPAIYELKPGSDLGDLLELAGGLTPLANRERCQLFRIEPGWGRVVRDVDLRTILQRDSSGKRRADETTVTTYGLADGDYVRITSLPTQVVNVVSLVGAVKNPGPHEYRPGMRVSDLLTSGQLTTEAYRDRAEIVRTDPVTYQTNVIEFNPTALFEGSTAEDHVLHRLDQIVISTQLRPPNLVLVEGEIKRPGYLTIETGERLSSVLRRAGGFTPNAFPPGVVLIRESVKQRQQTELERFIEAERQRLIAQSAGVAAGTAGAGGAAALSTAGSIAEQQVLSLRLKQLEAIALRVELGRVAVRLDTIEKLEGTEDDIILEARDRITIPTPPQTVSIIGSVKNPSTVVYRPGLELEDYLGQAGGLTEDANKREMYVMRANGTTDSAYLVVKNVQPGDTVVVPQKLETKTPPLALWSTVASIVGSLALTAAGIAVVGR